MIDIQVLSPGDMETLTFNYLAIKYDWRWFYQKSIKQRFFLLHWERMRGAHLIREFRKKNWKKSFLNDFIKKILENGSGRPVIVTNDTNTKKMCTTWLVPRIQTREDI